MVQLTGVVVEGDSLGPVPFATVYRARDQRGTITDEYGFFAIPARVGDTVRFSSIGLTESYLVVPDLTGQEMPDRMSVVQPLGRDTVMMDEARIYPWPSRERFKEEFLALRLEADARERARRNLDFDPMALYDRMSEMGSSPQENFRALQAQPGRDGRHAGRHGPGQPAESAGLGAVHQRPPQRRVPKALTPPCNTLASFSVERSVRPLGLLVALLLVSLAGSAQTYRVFGRVTDGAGQPSPGPPCCPRAAGLRRDGCGWPLRPAPARPR